MRLKLNTQNKKYLVYSEFGLWETAAHRTEKKINIFLSVLIADRYRKQLIWLLFGKQKERSENNENDIVCCDKLARFIVDLYFLPIFRGATGTKKNMQHTGTECKCSLCLFPIQFWLAWHGKNSIKICFFCFEMHAVHFCLLRLPIHQTEAKSKIYSIFCLFLHRKICFFFWRLLLDAFSSCRCSLAKLFHAIAMHRTPRQNRAHQSTKIIKLYCYLLYYFVFVGAVYPTSLLTYFFPFVSSMKFHCTSIR